MRKALLVLALIAASFAGGAVVNGPGLAWLRANLGISLLEVESQAGENKPKQESGTPHPSDPPAPAVLSPASGEKSPETSPDQIRPNAKASRRDTVNPPDLKPPSAARTAPKTTRSTIAESVESPPAVSLDLPPSTHDAASKDSSAPRDESILKTAVTPPVPFAQPETSRAAENSSDPLGSWAAIDRRLRSLGVRQFWVEGQPGQPVRFRCVVPVIGRGAMSQMFEAEAANLEAAAGLVARRITLWKATELEAGANASKSGDSSE